METYRFSDMLGNVTTLGLLQRSLQNDTFKQFTIFSGVLGTGKSTSAKIAALTLTCENPVDGQACLTCPSCRANLKAFSTTGESSNVKIVNVANLINREEVSNLLHNVFDLEATIGNQVYIFEEVHTLKDIKGAQTSFLPEIDRMPLNTYVIMCTTKVTDLEPELRSRALEFNFGRLTDKESMALIKKHVQDRGYVDLPSKIETIILKNSKGVPRTLLKAIDFIIDNSVTEEELLDFFQVISDGTFITLFQSMLSTNISLFIENVKNITANRTPFTVLSELKSFILRSIFLIEGGVSDGFTQSDKREVLELFSGKQLLQIAKIIDKRTSISASDLQILFLEIREVLSKRDTVSIISGKERVALAEKEQLKRLQIETDKASDQVNSAKLSKLSLNAIQSFNESSNT